MTPEQQKEILKIIAPALLNPDVQELWRRLEKYEKLKEENRRLLLLIDALMDNDIVIHRGEDDLYYFCGACGREAKAIDEVVHHHDCQVLEAKRLLEENQQ